MYWLPKDWGSAVENQQEPHVSEGERDGERDEERGRERWRESRKREMERER